VGTVYLRCAVWTAATQALQMGLLVPAGCLNQQLVQRYLGVISTSTVHRVHKIQIVHGVPHRVRA
jgi:hypothetical protein